MSGSRPTPLQYIPALDGVRAAAVMGVILYHHFRPPSDAPVRTGVAALVTTFTHPGWLGVDLFFVLSGFLITRILLHERGARRYFRNFYTRRALRILPLYFLVLGLMWVIYPDNRQYILLCAVFLANFPQPFGIRPVNAVLWSLAIEEHFYLIWPVLVQRCTTRTLLWVAAAVCAGTPVLRAVAYLHGRDIYYESWYRFDGLAWGACLAIVYTAAAHRRVQLFLLGGATIAGALISVSALATHGVLEKGTLCGASLQFTCAQALFFGALSIILSGYLPRSESVLAARPVVKIGQLSYCMYLIHQIVLDCYDALCGDRALHAGSSLLFVRSAACLAATIGIALLSSRYFEGPILRLKNSLA